jgi:hypothetical protein
MSGLALRHVLQVSSKLYTIERMMTRISIANRLLLLNTNQFSIDRTRFKYQDN